MRALAAIALALAPQDPVPALDCGYRELDWWLAERGVARAELPAPARVAGGGAELALGAEAAPSTCLRPEHVFVFEDSASLLLTDYSSNAFIDLLANAANALIATHGDRYDFFGFWLNFAPHHTLGQAVYVPLFNDVMGIGESLFDTRPVFGFNSTVAQGCVTMWNLNDAQWATGTGPEADFTRLVLGHELEHRFGMCLPDLLDGRRLQGTTGVCGYAGHWSWRVDGQGSAMELAEWVGTNPAVPQQTFVSFNTDIGGVYAYTDLYLMGFVSPAEMDAGNSELRYMETSPSCDMDYFGAISTFDSTDIIASAGPRVPDSTSAQHEFRMGWIVLHLPGAPPTPTELAKVVGMLEQHQLDFVTSTLGRGTMNDQLFDDCNCNGVPDGTDVTLGNSTDGNGNSVPDDCENIGASFCPGTGCPCGNDDPTAGCVNSTGSGAELVAVGSTSVSADDLLLVASHFPAGNSGLYFMGGSAFAPVFVADGLACTGGLFRYFPSVVDGAGSIQLATPVASAPAGTIQPGDTRYFQAWTRDVLCGPPPSPCPSPCGNSSNLSHGLGVTFTP